FKGGTKPGGGDQQPILDPVEEPADIVAEDNIFNLDEEVPIEIVERAVNQDNVHENPEGNISNESNEDVQPPARKHENFERTESCIARAKAMCDTYLKNTIMVNTPQGVARLLIKSPKNVMWDALVPPCRLRKFPCAEAFMIVNYQRATKRFGKTDEEVQSTTKQCIVVLAWFSAATGEQSNPS
ncbi:unnamed protein product, partial [Allacma fusca]